MDLSESIKQVGVLQPLLVLDKKDYYEIIAGNDVGEPQNLRD